jgi:hypothetical protein
VINAQFGQSITQPPVVSEISKGYSLDAPQDMHLGLSVSQFEQPAFERHYPFDCLIDDDFKSRTLETTSSF